MVVLLPEFLEHVAIILPGSGNVVGMSRLPLEANTLQLLGALWMEAILAVMGTLPLRPGSQLEVVLCRYIGMPALLLEF